MIQWNCFTPIGLHGLDSSALNQNSGLIINDGTQAHEGNSNPPSRNGSRHGTTELEELRAKNAQYKEINRRLTQELNGKDDQIEALSSQMARLMDEVSSDYNSRKGYIPKLPNFSGRSNEKIEVWITQFDEALYFLNDAEKLYELLPKFRDTAAEFVFGQLTPKVRRDYNLLVSELITRFQKIETPRMYRTQLENRKQRVGESIHDFACDLKRLYDKAYPGRPANVRNEDLVEKFMDGLLDDVARFQVEYHKSPAMIDQAVYEVIHYQEVFGESEKKTYSPTTQSN